MAIAESWVLVISEGSNIYFLIKNIFANAG